MQERPVVTRFAPSPTGYLHIGGARTALFNWLFARRHGGMFRLRIEDTDRERSTQAATDALIEGLRWLGLDWDDEIVFQHARAARHRAVAEALLASGAAYRCYATPEALAEMREAQKASGAPQRYDGRWRDRDPAEAPAGAPFVVRIRTPQDGETVIADQVQGRVAFRNDVLDDFVILRSDGTPTYMLAVVVDDQDMGVTHVIRGDDHLTNAARQRQLIDALGWPVPVYAHLPLLHGPDGQKLSKRHGALGIHEYDGLGFLPEAMRNYLLRLGWSHGDDEIITTDQAIAWFGLDAIGRSPARLDIRKLEHLNAHYLREADPDALAGRVLLRLGRPADDPHRPAIAALMPALVTRAKTLIDLAEGCAFLFTQRPLAIEPDAAGLLDGEARALLGALRPALDTADWTVAALETAIRDFADAKSVKLGAVAQPLRAALTGRRTSPPVFDVMAALGRAESLARIEDQAA